MKRFVGFRTLESRFFLIFTLMFFVTILTMQLVSSRFTVTTVRTSTLETNRVLLEQLVNQINTYIGGMERVAGAVLDEPSVTRFLAEPSAAPGGDVATEDVQDRLTAYVRARDDVSSILLFRSDGHSVAGDPDASVAPWTDYVETDWFKAARAVDGGTAVSTSYVQNIIAGRYSWVVSLSRELRAGDGSYLGMLLVDLKFNRIKQLCESLVVGRKGYNFILDGDGNYVYHPTQQLVYSGIKSEPISALSPLLGQEESIYRDGEKSFLVAPSVPTGWYVVSVTFDSDVLTGWRYVQATYAVIALVLLIGVGLVTNFMTQRITRPVRQLEAVMKSVETGEFRTAGELDATDEIRELAREYDIMVGRIGELMEANTREQELKRKSDLKALQAQINPHFLYNTLDSIIWMGEMKRSEEVVKMTSALSRLFRISISKGQELIPLRDELEHVRSYLTIQEMRYRDRFSYNIDIGESLLDLTVLKITLQPLVENAIYHGIRDLDFEGRIEISGEQSDGLLLLTVQDNGNGMDADELEKLIQGIDTIPSERPGTSGQGTGVRNVHERIRLYFGDEFGLAYDSSVGNGTKITVSLPAESAEAHR